MMSYIQEMHNQMEKYMSKKKSEQFNHLIEFKKSTQVIDEVKVKLLA